MQFALPIPVQQFLNQLVFLWVGKLVFKLPVTWVEIGLVLVFSVVLEHALTLLRERKITRFSTASLSTGFNLAFMLGTTALGVYAVALFAGLLQKHLFKKLLGEHFWNPSNFGITVAFLLFPSYTYATSSGWGQSAGFAVLIALLGTVLLLRLRIALVPYVVVAAHAVFLYLFYSHNWGDVWLRSTSASFLLFSFFMVTDPKGLPSTRAFLIVHAILTAFLVAVIPLWLGEKDVSLFLALVLSGTCVPLWRYIERTGVPGTARRAALAATLAITVLALAVYVSPYNILRNTMASYEQTVTPKVALPAVAPPDVVPVPHAPGAPIEGLWESVDRDLYKVGWNKGYIEKRSLTKARSTSKPFRLVESALPPISQAIGPRDLWDETRLYAALGVGDLNQDGYLDIVTARIKEPLRILVNNRKGQFQDATANFFPGRVPDNIEQLAMADLNNDGYLDLIVTFSQYYSTTPGAVYLLNAKSKQYEATFSFGQGLRSSGGISLYDLNRDRILDFYVSYGIDYFSEDGRQLLNSDPDAFFLSQPGGWSEAYAATFGEEAAMRKYAGMTALFTDFNQDGEVDLLVGNDFSDPSLTMVGQKGGGFTLAAPGYVENNTYNSMSYFAADFDNDGRLELWENGVAQPQGGNRLPFRKEFKKPGRTLLNQELDWLEKQTELSRLDCDVLKHPLTPWLCRDFVLQQAALRSSDISICAGIISTGYRHTCRKMANLFEKPSGTPTPAEFKYDVEIFPKQLPENVLLKWDARAGRYQHQLKGNAAALFTGFTFNAYPFDINNDGLLDLYVGNGMLARSHDVNRLLINEPQDGHIWFADRASEYGLDLEDDARGIAVADFDLDGDGDVMINNYLSDPAYFENLQGGKAALIELRSRRSNYYAVGAVLKLVTGKQIQTRVMDLGGRWNTSQPFVQHFALPTGTADYLEVRWPDGAVTRHPGIEAGYRYVIYE